MKFYSGTKNLLAQKINKGDYNLYRGWDIPENENPNEEGYIVEYLDGGKANHEKHDGYISWSPADVFEKSYNQNGELNFGQALEALKSGKRIARKGWNGKGMFLFLLPAGKVPIKAIHDPKLKQVIEEQVDGNEFEALGSIRMWTTNSRGRKAVLTGWLASQTDMLENDWVILD